MNFILEKSLIRFKDKLLTKNIFQITIIFFLACLSIFYAKQIYLNKNYTFEKVRIVNICLNKQTFSRDIAIWTLLTDGIESYSVSAIKLLKSIKKNVKITSFDAFVLELVNKPIPNIFKVDLLKAGWKICQVNRIAPRDEEKTHGRFRDQFTKLLLWNATGHKAHYYFDSDTFVIRNVDDFFSFHNKLIPDMHKIGCTMDLRETGWQETFNMGVFIVKPNQSEFNRLIQLKNDPNLQYEMIMSEQGFLNVVYRNLWYEIGFENNANLAVYTAKRDFWEGKARFINIIHYTMEKPWACSDAYKVPCDFWRQF